ncbi:hypothetical protein B0H17DRAFT_1087922 [Mycena rosella]|uniref:Leucine rich repeat domain protein n=1 Tax=Mycena rosella TaxID=1033263 RepID=A0AAD7CXL1_MYCRO|nr:hypothetical protein B0H17DRAFT_1087922 [Mycena rosella]
MFDVEDTRWSGAPSSSPPSSPTAYIDSSPASSPGPDDSVSFPDESDIFRESPPHGSPPLDPFAASAKGSWNPPEYEKGGKKNRRMSPSSPTRIRVKKPRLLGPEASLETVVASSPRTSISLTAEEKETVIWDTAISKMVDTGNGAIDLENCNLSTIPHASVLDLGKFCVLEDNAARLNARVVVPLGPPPLPLPRQFGRSFTAPAILGPGSLLSRVNERTANDIQLYLARNQISRLPVQLLFVERLTVLSLRNNKLKAIPPEVRNLRALHTLNVSGNQLRYLPAELADMILQALHVFPNPFLDPEEHLSAKHQLRHAKSAQGRVAISPPSRSSARVPPLVELAFRSMFLAESGVPCAQNHKRRLAQYYELPLDRDSGTVIPPHLRRVLHAVHPGSVCSDKASEPVDDEPSFGSCPSPRHDRVSMFVAAAEERYTWETVVAGVPVGGSVPLKWRGCQWGCLDFLGVGMEPPEIPNPGVADMEVDEQDGDPEFDGVFQPLFGGGVPPVLGRGSDFEDEEG